MAKTSKFIFLYNVVNEILWIIILCISCKYAFYKNIYNIEHFWGQYKTLITVTQSLAICEIIFSLIGITKSVIGIVISQIFSRLFIVYLIFDYLPKNNRFIIGCLISWSIIEIIRYLIYGLKQLNIENDILLTLRNRAPLILYPTGIFSEVYCIFSSLDNIYNTSKLRKYPYPMPNNINFEIDIYYVCIFVLILYIPGSIILYYNAIKRYNKKIKPKEKYT